MKSRSAVMEKRIIHTCASLVASTAESSMLLTVPNGTTVVNTSVPSPETSDLKGILVIEGIDLLNGFFLRLRNIGCCDQMTKTKSNDEEDNGEILLERHVFDDFALLRLRLKR